MKKVLLIIALIAICGMAGCASAVVLDSNAPAGTVKDISGRVTDMQFGYQSYVKSTAYLFVINDEEWVTLSNDGLIFGISAVAEWDTIQQIKKNRYYVFHFRRENVAFGVLCWKLVQIDEISGLG